MPQWHVCAGVTSAVDVLDSLVDVEKDVTPRLVIDGT